MSRVEELQDRVDALEKILLDEKIPPPQETKAPTRELILECRLRIESASTPSPIGSQPLRLREAIMETSTRKGVVLLHDRNMA